MYSSVMPDLFTLLGRIEETLKTQIKVSSVPTYKSRVKSFPSYYRKLLKNMPESAPRPGTLPLITDILGIRIICAFLQDLTDVEKQLCGIFKVFEVERKGADRTFREFGYESTHILLAVPPEMRKDLRVPDKLLFEIQVRTILQDAWAEVEHELVYKSEFSPFDLPLKRKLASINASLSLADIIFQEIRDYQNRLNSELDKRRGSFYLQADKLTDHPGITRTAAVSNPDAGHIVPAEITDPALTYVQGTIDDMILDAIQAHNDGKLSQAVMIYTRIIEAQPNEVILSVIYKHRGMAFFAQSRYEEALSDFRMSAENKPDNYRAYYYVGIVQSAMGNDLEAIASFDQSLSLNRFQAYVYFRQAHSYYNLGRYSESLVALDTAVSLGLKKEDEEKLRMMIARKLDI